MSGYETVFYWVGVICAGFFVLIGMSVFTAWVMNLVWRKFKDGKKLADVIVAYNHYKNEKHCDYHNGTSKTD